MIVAPMAPLSQYGRIPHHLVLFNNPQGPGPWTVNPGPSHSLPKEWGARVGREAATPNDGQILTH